MLLAPFSVILMRDDDKKKHTHSKCDTAAVAEVVTMENESK